MRVGVEIRLDLKDYERFQVRFQVREDMDQKGVEV